MCRPRTGPNRAVAEKIEKQTRYAADIYNVTFGAAKVFRKKLHAGSALNRSDMHSYFCIEFRSMPFN
jgi:hypothetical protein